MSAKGRGGGEGHGKRPSLQNGGRREQGSGYL